MNITLLKPNYFDKFKCIGSSCEDNCCNCNWEIFIDKETYKKLINCKNYKIKSLSNKCIIPFEKNKNKVRYASIEKNKEGRCCFFEEGICYIHKELGESYLGNVCYNYPREISIVGNIIEMSLKLSCPEVARIALLNPNMMEFNEEPLKNQPRMINKSLSSNKDNRYFWELREFTIDTLQNRKFSIEERLFILGFLYTNLKDNSEETMSEIPYLINRCKNYIESGQIKDIFDKAPSDYKSKMLFIKNLIDARFEFSSLENKALNECLEEFNEGIKEDYKEILSKYYNPFIKEHEYILENLLVTHVFSELFPYETENSMYYEYLYMLINFLLIKHYLCGIASFNKGLDEKKVVKLIYSYFRKFENGSKVLKFFIENCKMEKEIKIEHICLLLKD